MTEADYAIVFSGGGALGAWEVGCLQAVIEYHGGKPPRIVTGASAGALNAAALCSAMPLVRLSALWTDLVKSDVFVIRNLRWRMLRAAFKSLAGQPLSRLKAEVEQIDSIFDTKPLTTTLTNILRPHYFDFEASPVDIAISATELNAGVPEIFYKLAPGTTLPPRALKGRLAKAWTRIESFDFLVQALMGTTALPILFPPMEGRFDGGVLLNQPITPAILLGGLHLYVFIPSPVALGRTRNLLEIGSTVMTTWLATSLFAQIEQVKLRNYIRKQTEDPLIQLCLVRPSSDLGQDPGAGLLSFGEKVPELIANGYASAQQRLKLFDPNNDATWY